jgi:DNA-binding CsgD family transcriptional regulator
MEEGKVAARSANPPPDARQQSKELAAARLQLDAAHEFLAEIRTALTKQGPPSISKLVQKIEARLDSSGREWEDFEEHFDLLHDDFIKKLKKRHPVLSMQELKLCAYLKMKLSTKEIAQRMRLSVRGIETGRYRLRKKMGMDDGENLAAFLEGI